MAHWFTMFHDCHLLSRSSVRVYQAIHTYIIFFVLNVLTHCPATYTYIPLVCPFRFLKSPIYITHKVTSDCPSLSKLEMSKIPPTAAVSTPPVPLFCSRRLSRILGKRVSCMNRKMLHTQEIKAIANPYISKTSVNMTAMDR